MPRRNNSLTHQQSARLFRWIEERKEWAAGTIARDVAADATETLGFRVTESNVLHARRALGITKPKREEPVSSDAVRTLAVALVALYRQAGNAPPRAVLDIAGIRAHEKRTPAEPTLFAPGPCAADRVAP